MAIRIPQPLRPPATSATPATVRDGKRRVAGLSTRTASPFCPLAHTRAVTLPSNLPSPDRFVQSDLPSLLSQQDLLRPWPLLRCDRYNLTGKSPLIKMVTP